MAEMGNAYSTSSREAEIDARLDALIAKIMDGSATAADVIEYQEQLATRILLMGPRPYRSSEARRAETGFGMRRKQA